MRACTLCTDAGKSRPCETCAAEARRFYAAPPSPSGLIRLGALAAICALGAGWWLTEIAIGVSNAKHLIP